MLFEYFNFHLFSILINVLYLIFYVSEIKTRVCGHHYISNKHQKKVVFTAQLHHHESCNDHNFIF